MADLSSSLIHPASVSAIGKRYKPSGDALSQILILDEPKTDADTPSRTHYKTTLWTDVKSKFEDFPLSQQNEQKEKTVADRLPAVGAKVNSDFITPKEENISQYTSVRLLLQTRLISQLIARSWLAETNVQVPESKPIQYLFITANQPPENYEGKSLDQLSLMSKNSMKAYSIKEKNNDNLDGIVLPGFRNWESLRLSLLLAGQAYLKNEHGEYIPLSHSILGAYEIAQLYYFKVSWSTFIGTIEELAKAGVTKQYPPAQEITIPYPPRPPILDEGNLCLAEIEKWANAPIGTPYVDNDPLQFYPGSEDNEDLVKNHVPPFPYLPLSST